MAEAAKNNAKSRARVSAAFWRYPPDKRDSMIERVALGRDPEPAVLSSYTVRAETQKAWIRALLRHFKRHKSDANLRYFLFTFTIFDGFTYEDAPVLAVDTMRLKAQRLLKSIGLQGVCTFEIDVMAKKEPGEHARRVILHVHGLCWTWDPAFSHVAEAQRLSALPRYANPFGIDGVSLVSRAMARSRADPTISVNKRLFKHSDRDQIARSIAFLAYYLTKAPIYTKNRFIGRDGKIRIRYDAEKFRLKTALRLSEMLSHFTPEQMLFAVGDEGNAVRIDIRTQLRRRFGHIGAAARRKEEIKLNAAWERFFLTNRCLSFATSIVRRRK